MNKNKKVIDSIEDDEISALLGETSTSNNDAVNDATTDAVKENTPVGEIGFDVNSLKSNIEKYSLGGAINRALFTNKDGKLKIIGIEDNKSLYAIISSRRKIFDEDMQFGIYNTSNMLGLLSLLDGNVTVEMGKQNFVLSQNDVSVEINFADSSVIGSDNYKEPNPAKLPKEYEIDMELNKEIIDKILKSIGAFSSSEKNLYFQFKRHKPVLVIGDEVSKSNKVNFDISTFGKFKEFDGQLAFFLKFFKSILSSVKTMDKITLKASIAGIMIIECTDENNQCKYFMGADQENTTIK